MPTYQKVKLMTRASIAIMVLFSLSVAAHADQFPKSGIFQHAETESELNFAKRYLGFPDEECSFKLAKRLAAKRFRISTNCYLADGGQQPKASAILEKTTKGWRLTRGQYVVDFTK